MRERRKCVQCGIFTTVNPGYICAVCDPDNLPALRVSKEELERAVEKAMEKQRPHMWIEVGPPVRPHVIYCS